MIGILGQATLSLAFVSSILATWFYYVAARNGRENSESIANAIFFLKGAFTFFASGLLVYLIFTHQFQYYYVYNYTSTDLQNVYLWAAFYSGQEGSLLLWILSSFLVGLAIIRWATPTYRAPVMFFMTLTQVFLLSMVSGFPIPGWGDLGASPFRTLASEMPDAQVFRNNPDFVPSEGSGLNDLLRSPWIIIHPPVIFLGFAMMTVPYAFALSSLWKRKYHEWIHAALPWTLGASLCLLTAIFLGGYWAYVTLSFGGYWAWDPVENASLVPWIFGLAGIHAMLIQKKHASSHKASIIFAILAYVTVVYQTFLTRSGILGDSSVHSFVDLGLYNHLLLFMLVVAAIGVGMLAYRYRDLPKPGKESPFLSREFMMFAGAMVLFLAGLVIILGTSSPVLGRLFVDNPTPPDQTFYNNWTLPFGILIGLMTVITQMLWWKRHDAESLASALIVPTLIASVVTITAVILSDMSNLAYMIYLFAGIFAIAGNGKVMLQLIWKNPRRVGGTFTHIGFAVMMIGFLGSAFDRPMVDAQTREYNRAVAAGQVTDDDGFRVNQEIEFVELEKGKPKLIDGRYMVTFKGAEITEHNRPGEQEYEVLFEDVDSGESFVMKPSVYPMLSNSSPGAVEWTVDVDVRGGWLSDIFMYVAGSYLVDQEIERMAQENPDQHQSIDQLGPEMAEHDPDESTVRIPRGGTVEIGEYTLNFRDYIYIDEDELPEGSIIGVKADIVFVHRETGETHELQPEYVLTSDGESQYAVNPPEELGIADGSIRFLEVLPESDEIEIELTGVEGAPEREWILLAAEHKLMISVVWLGTFLLMIGFSISIIYRWADQKKREQQDKRDREQASGDDDKAESEFEAEAEAEAESEDRSGKPVEPSLSDPDGEQNDKANSSSGNGQPEEDNIIDDRSSKNK
ncbi:heme lyase CcmF/NrfE family subunit [Natronogracilivirga saccharolytica]|uniref:Cytochrome c biogenesis protein CcsA n=1 Tax=Natronogracilivirga saccharolytica TaxID=2812953 RepID=A0A8J7RKR6_9BACT|nr:cytochrome c biogenesis protein CcsA [Natronogracilivirga saccharolytica]MBP3192630.1 cytochrome c biogenesis protein CcsA [Natronogracilivirga saccharolytica]